MDKQLLMYTVMNCGWSWAWMINYMPYFMDINYPCFNVDVGWAQVCKLIEAEWHIYASVN